MAKATDKDLQLASHQIERIEQRVLGVIDRLAKVTSGNVTHECNGIRGNLRTITDTYIPQLKEMIGDTI